MRQVLVSLSCWAASTVSFAGCFEESGHRYNIDPLLLRAIAQVESNMNPAAIHRNTDHSVDYGLMQINSMHLARLNARGISSRDLLEKPCVAIHAGAEILSGFIQRHGYNWTAVGAYNAGSHASRAGLRERYSRKVWREYRQLLAARQRVTSPSHAARRGAAVAFQEPAQAAVHHVRSGAQISLNGALRGWFQTLFRRLARQFSVLVRL